MLGDKLGKKATTNKSRVPEARSKIDKQDVVPSGKLYEIGKERTPKRKFLTKKRNEEWKVAEKKKLVRSSDSDVDEDWVSWLMSEGWPGQ